jgi:FAD/FMN-containing dehydrogenase
MRIDPAPASQPEPFFRPTTPASCSQRRLRAETQGEVLFDAARAGATPPTRRSTRSRRSACSCRRNERERHCHRHRHRRDLKVPVLPRGGGTSQCGQTTGAALVIDNSKHLRKRADVNVEERTATVEPGLVLDHLNAQLKPHGLWYPVDVSTSAQATLGGMAGNNSCGSRSIAYGNMVHNVLGARPGCPTASCTTSARGRAGRARELGIAQFVRGLARREHREQIEAHWPKVLRRVAGYNLDIFDNQSEKPYTADGSVNLAHLLVGSEGTLAYTQQPEAQAGRAAARQGAGRRELPDLLQGDGRGAAHRQAGPTLTAVELVDRTMIELSLQNPAFKPHGGNRADRQARCHPAGGVLRAPTRPRCCRKLKAIGRADGRPGPARQRGRDARRRAQKNLWEVRKAGLNIMMSLKGDGKPVSFIEDCAVPLEHLAEYTDALTEVFASTAAAAPGTRTPRSARCTCGPSSTCARDGAPRCAPSPKKPRAGAQVQGRLQRRARRRPVPRRVDRMAVRPGHQRGLSREIKQKLDPANLFNPGKIIDPPRMDDGALFRFAPPTAPKPYRRIELKPALDWSAWNVQNDPVTEKTTAPGTGGDSTGGFAKAVEMCNNNGHCRKFDAGTMCPSYRVTRDEQHLTRGRANTLRLALSGQLGPDAFTSEAVHETMDLCVGCKGCKRDCPTGVDMAKMKIEFLDHYKKRHGHTLKDKLVAYLPDYAHKASRLPGC